MSKLKVLGQVNLPGSIKVRVVQLDEESYQAQVKEGPKVQRWYDAGPETETMDHAFYFAFEAIATIFYGSR